VVQQYESCEQILATQGSHGVFSLMPVLQSLCEQVPPPLELELDELLVDEVLVDVELLLEVPPEQWLAPQ